MDHEQSICSEVVVLLVLTLRNLSSVNGSPCEYTRTDQCLQIINSLRVFMTSEDYEYNQSLFATDPMR